MKLDLLLVGCPLERAAETARKAEAAGFDGVWVTEVANDPFLTLASDVLRGPSFWTAAEREYLAMYTSRLNDCPFCVRIHSETVRLESRGAIDVNHAGSMRPQVAAVLPLLDKLTPHALARHQLRCRGGTRCRRTR